MTTTSLPVTAARRETSLLRSTARVHDVAELTKPRIAVLVGLSVAAAALVGAWGQPDPWLVLHAIIGTMLIAASGTILNQVIERDTDRVMKRTANRPIAAGRLGIAEAISLAIGLVVLGVGYLALTTGALTAFWGAATWILYTFAYTPLKRRSPWNTAVGAVAGAMPVLIGWSAAGGVADVRCGAMFLLLFLWQFPHFMAIAWLYRAQYRAAGIQVATVTDPSGRAAGVQAVLGAVSLLPVTMVFAMTHFEVTFALAFACLLGIGQMLLAWQFFRQPNDRRARALLRASLVYLPTVLCLLATSPWI